MLAVSQGRLVCLSTPFGKRGFFHQEWEGKAPWVRTKIVAEQCPRIPREFLEEEQLALGQRWFDQEYGCAFVDTVDQVFAYEHVMAAMADDIRPLFAE
jgi:hypothetical protein